MKMRCLLKSKFLRVINYVGLDLHVGFSKSTLHYMKQRNKKIILLPLIAIF